MKLTVKNEINKTKNNLKAGAEAVYHVLDIASNGSLSMIQENLAQVFQGFLKAKFLNIIQDVLSQQITEKELIDFINDQSDKNREFLSSIIFKNMHTDNRLQTYILSVLLVRKMKNKTLTYYESSLFTNINSLTYHDFECFYSLWEGKIENRLGYHYNLNEDQFYYVDVQTKLFSLGILGKPNLISGFAPEHERLEKKLYIFEATGLSEVLFNILEQYFEKDH